MSIFFDDDLMCFKDDESIVATVERTWSDDSGSSFEAFDHCYIHKDLDPYVEDDWFILDQIRPGYVLVAFMHEHDGCCFLPEDSLKLMDRSLTVGDPVKNSLSDSQSGVVISTSLMCELQPLCSEAAYNTHHHIPAEGHCQTNTPERLTGDEPNDRAGNHGFPKSVQIPPLTPANEPRICSPIRASAQDLTFYDSYREEDYIVYQGWAGQVKEVSQEATVRLTNGSVVVVENIEELDEPLWIPGSPSYELVQRLDRAGYYRSHSLSDEEPWSKWAGPCYPGQRVQTKKGNLRRGRWKFGAYDPNVLPQGIVAEVRCVQLEINWIWPDPSLPLANRGSPPPSSLGLDEIESGELLVFDRNRLPVSPLEEDFQDASFSPDIDLGHMVRFKHPPSETISSEQIAKDSLVEHANTGVCDYKRIPRTSTQGFDMNVLQVRSISTKAKVRWQDCSVTEESSVQLHPYPVPDFYEVWPGEKVSLKAQEERTDSEIMRSRKVGVVQSVDAAGRMARVRWYPNAAVEMNSERFWHLNDFGYGSLDDEIAELPLYDIANRKPLLTSRGAMVVISPITTSSSIGTPFCSTGEASPPSPSKARPVAPSDTSAQTDGTTTQVVSGPVSSDKQGDSSGIDVSWFGEITRSCLDGDVIVRLAAAHVVRDIKVPADRIIIVADEDGSSDSEDTDLSEEPDWSDEMSVSAADTETSSDRVSPVDVSVEYEGGAKIIEDGAEDEEMWITDEEENKQPTDSEFTEADENLMNANSLRPVTVEEQSARIISDGPIICSSFTSMPLQFSILGCSPPKDHHFLDKTRTLTANVMRRISKENAIMQNSLPDGVFVRCWDSRFDLLRILIVGPFDTPYEFAPFVFDLQYGAAFPNSPPNIFFHSWANGVGRINPNLYEDGKICLSLLGTWDGDSRSEEWSSDKSTILQLIVSIMGLVLVKEPYFSKRISTLFLSDMMT